MYHNSDYRLQTGCGFIIGLLLIFWVGSGLFSYAKQFYEERQLLPTPITGTIVSYELYRDYEHTIKDIVVEFDYNGKTYTLDSREQVVFTTKTLHEEISDDFSTIKVYVNPEEPQKSRVTRRLAGWETLLVICICSFVCLGLTGFLIIRLIRVW
jgi:hypothetical protein